MIDEIFRVLDWWDWETFYYITASSAAIVVVLSAVLSKRLGDFLFDSYESTLSLFIEWSKSTIVSLSKLISSVFVYSKYETILSSFVIDPKDADLHIPISIHVLERSKDKRAILLSKSDPRRALQKLGFDTKMSFGRIVLQGTKKRISKKGSSDFTKLFIDINSSLGDFGKTNRIELQPYLYFCGIRLFPYFRKGNISKGAFGVLGKRSYDFSGVPRADYKYGIEGINPAASDSIKDPERDLGNQLRALILVDSAREELKKEYPRLSKVINGLYQIPNRKNGFFEYLSSPILSAAHTKIHEDNLGENGSDFSQEETTVVSGIKEDLRRRLIREVGQKRAERKRIAPTY